MPIIRTAVYKHVYIKFRFLYIYVPRICICTHKEKLHAHSFYSFIRRNTSTTTKSNKEQNFLSERRCVYSAKEDDDNNKKYRRKKCFCVSENDKGRNFTILGLIWPTFWIRKKYLWKGLKYFCCELLWYYVIIRYIYFLVIFF